MGQVFISPTLVQTGAAPSRAAWRSAPPPRRCGFCPGAYPRALPRSDQTTSKAKLGSGCHRALLRHRCAPVTSHLGTETHPLPNHLRHPCTTHLQPRQCTLTVANSLYMFCLGQAQQLCLCLCVWHIRFQRGGISTSFPQHRFGRCRAGSCASTQERAGRKC